MLSGENGILQKATTAKTETEKSQEKEIVTLAYNSALSKKVSNGDSTSVTAGDLNTELTNQGATANGSNPINVTFTVSKRQYTINANGEITYAGIKNGDEQDDNELPTALGTKPYFPSDKFKQLEDTDLTTGLVITDKSENEEVGNEYVWIEVPSTAVDSTATGGPDYSEVSGATDYTKIATALRTYCTKDSHNANLITVTDGTESTKDFNSTTVGYSDTFFEGCGFSSSDDYNNLYHKMLKSIYENGGFWIGRYEAGATNARNNGDSASGITPLSKIDLYPINWVTCSEAQTIASNVPNKGIYNSSLMFGIQWDLMLRHLSNKGILTGLLTENSRDWGNYNIAYDLSQDSIHGYKGAYRPWSGSLNLTWTAIENEYTHQQMYYAGNSETEVPFYLLSTGATTRNMKKNIYDISGNLYELTLENSNISNDPCVLRGGFLDDTAGWRPTSNRAKRSLDSLAFSLTRFPSFNLLKI